MSDPRPWRARVLRPGGGIAGAGVLIDQRHVLTCAHVVNQALGRDRQEQEPPDGEVEVDFVEAEAGPVRARVVDGGWVPIGSGGVGDVAVLEVAMDAPQGARPAVLRRPPHLRGERFDTYGYPRGYDTGVGATGVLAAWGGPVNQWVELQAVQLPGHRVEGGFSGAPVYDQDARAVVGIVVADDRLAEAKLAWMLPVRTLMRLLGSSWPRMAAIVRSSSMYQPGELVGHWSPKARGVERDVTRGWYFTGRRQVLKELAEWLAEGQADGRVRVVTGGPGSGKSAVLARLVTLSDPLYRERVPGLDSADPEVPPSGSVGVAVWARNKTLEDVIAAIAQATEVDADSPDGLIDGLMEGDRPGTIVVDALDEAVDAFGIATNLLRPLAAAAGARVLVATRPGREGELVTSLGREAMRWDLDHPPYLVRADLVEFVYRRLLLADDPTARTPYRSQEELASRVAVAVAARAFPTFLVAQLTSKALVHAEKVVDVEAPGWELAFPGSVFDAMDGYLNRLAEDAPTQQERRARKRRLQELLSPLAYAEGDGMPRKLWPAAATALADRRCELEELDWLVDTAADYLIEQARGDGGPVYRLYHEALAEYLRPASAEQESRRQRRLAAALADEVPKRPSGDRDWSAAHPYLARHLATHAALGGLLDQILDDPQFLLAADPVRLLRALPAAGTQKGRQAAGVYQLAVHQLHDRPLDEAAAYLELAARQQRADALAEGIRRIGLIQPWSVPWAVWQPATAHRIAGRHMGGALGVAVGEVDGHPVAVSGSTDEMVRVWDLRAGTPFGEPLTGHSGGVYGVAVGEVDGRPLAVSVSGDSTVRVWDLRAGSLVGEPLAGHSGWVNAVAIGEVDGDPLAVSGGADDRTVRVWDLREGSSVGEPLTGHTSGVYGVAMGQVDGRSVAISSGADATVRVWELRTGAPADELVTVYTGEVYGVAVGQVDGRPVVVSGGADRMVRVWDLHAGTLVGQPIAAHTGGVHGVAVGEVDGCPVVVSGGSLDRTVQVWDLRTRTLFVKPLTGHSSGVNGVAVGEVDGRPVAVSGGNFDQTVRVWDLRAGTPLGQPFVGHNRGVRAVALAEVDGCPVVVSGGSFDGTLRLWDLRAGTPLGEPLTGHTRGILAIAVGQVDGRPVAVSGDSSDGTVRMWDLRAGGSLGEPLTGHTGGVYGVALGELDGRPIAVSGGADQTLRVWDLSTRRSYVLECGAPINAVAMAMSSQILVATARGLALIRLLGMVPNCHDGD